MFSIPDNLTYYFFSTGLCNSAYVVFVNLCVLYETDALAYSGGVNFISKSHAHPAY
jgi:hypothetical protein